MLQIKEHNLNVNSLDKLNRNTPDMLNITNKYANNKHPRHGKKKTIVMQKYYIGNTVSWKTHTLEKQYNGKKTKTL